MPGCPASDGWVFEVAARTDLDRWLLEIEIDALSALVLGLTPEQLAWMYRSQFRSLRRYEHETVFDAEGIRIARDHNAWSARQSSFEADQRSAGRRAAPLWDRIAAYNARESDVDLGPLVPPFRPANRVVATTHAYWTFVDRYNLTPAEDAERPAA
jgi:hypothetical protein